MTNTTKLLVAALVAAVGCSTGTQHQEPQPEARTEVQQPTEVASYEARNKTDKHTEEHHAREHKLDPNSPMGQGKMMLEQGKLTEAAAHFETITAAEPDNAKAWMLYGYALHGAGKLDEALAIHKKAASFEKTAPVALYNIACVHSLQGDTDAAFAALDEAVAAGFDMADHLDKDEDLANIRNDARFPAFIKAVEANATKHKAEKAHKADGAECDAKHGADTI